MKNLITKQADHYNGILLFIIETMPPEIPDGLNEKQPKKFTDEALPIETLKAISELFE